MSIKNIKIITLSLFIGLIFAGGITLAAAIWQGTGWIQNGAVIDAQKMRDNFDYLYAMQNVSTAECNENILGIMRYTDGVAQYCNGAEWENVSVGDGGAGMLFFDTPGEHQFTVPDGVRSVKVTVIGGGGGARVSGRFGKKGGDSYFGDIVAEGGGEVYRQRISNIPRVRPGNGSGGLYGWSGKRGGSVGISNDDNYNTVGNATGGSSGCAGMFGDEEYGYGGTGPRSSYNAGGAGAGCRVGVAEVEPGQTYTCVVGDGGRPGWRNYGKGKSGLCVIEW